VKYVCLRVSPNNLFTLRMRSELIESEGKEHEALVTLNLKGDGNVTWNGLQRAAKVVECRHRHTIESSYHVTRDKGTSAVDPAERATTRIPKGSRRRAIRWQSSSRFQ